MSKSTIDLKMREAMTLVIKNQGGSAEITYNLGGIPWKVTVEIDTEKMLAEKGVL